MQYIAICGTVGSGKTTLLRRLLAHFGPRAAFHEERPQDNPYISDYYSDSKRWSFHSQVTFLSLENLVIAEYRRDQGDLSEDEFAVLCKLAKGIEALMPRIDKYVYLDCSVQTVLSHMRKRGRDYEDELDLMYVYELKALYDKWAQTLPPERTLRVDMDRGEYDLNEIIAFLEQ